MVKVDSMLSCVKLRPTALSYRFSWLVVMIGCVYRHIHLHEYYHVHVHFIHFVTLTYILFLTYFWYPSQSTVASFHLLSHPGDK